MRAGRRGGFTLLELLVVLAIITLLVALTAGAVLRYTGTQQGSNTNTTLSKLTLFSRRQWNTLSEQAFRESIPSTAAISYVQQIAGTDPARMQVVWVKLRQRQAYPRSFDEALNVGASALPTLGGVSPPGELNPLATYSTYLNGLGITGSNANMAAYESSACLLMALQRTVGGGGLNPDDLGVGAVRDFPAYSTAGTTTGSNVKALVDGWGSPLAFFRTPTGSTELNPPASGGSTAAPPSGAGNDTSDPQGLLCSAGWQMTSTGATTTQYTNFASVFGYSPPLRGSGAPQSFKLQPLIVSPGADKKLDLDGTAASTGAYSGDNISNADQ
jgi:prepilin-type N-terminal cleavage/methylation domain-containing protein